MKSKVAIASLIFGIFVSMATADEMKIDGTSKETFTLTAKAMVESLKPDEKETFQKGLLNLIITRYPPAQGLEGFPLLALMPEAMEVAHTTMNGVTKDEILERGRELAKKTAAVAKPDYAAIRSCLQRNVIVSNARIEKTDFGRNIMLDVTNNLPWSISFVHVGYKVTTPGRSVPWSDENFGMDVNGGIEPGETRSIATSAFGLPEIAKQLQTEAQILDVADAEKRHLVGEVKFIGHPEQLTPNGCK
ncbi:MULTISPECIES: hypothetical protein [unclassified Mesorhizobium]|uniref:hypothetical protein n=1 Tax=unclassified Mesorhizobium TaxID=325217 RepID=UPI001093B60E|nr:MULTISPECIES: hypothetical protein [unclassified Mesorhizobium]TGT91714.1 hypothetical protein EN804_01170 [Mesorhizobium sp. M8A.F.Ca.ET.161.01.1.1]TGV44741.1 hypothetical protein EN785_01170 [Mesorhizobium sp. M8A.F.Ca.ET.142.01.1.1]